MKSKFNILIIEDAQKHLKDMQNKLSQLNTIGYKLIFKYNFEDAEKLIKKDFFIATSLDQRIPKESIIDNQYGKELAYKFNKENPFSYKMIYTAFPQHKIAGKLAQSGFEYLDKSKLTFGKWASYLIESSNHYLKDKIFEEIKNTLIYPFSNFKKNSGSDFKFYKYAISLLFQAFIDSMKYKNNIQITSNSIEAIKILCREIESIDNFVTNEWKKVFNQDFIHDLEFVNKDNVSELLPFIIQKMSIFTIHPICMNFNRSLKNYKIEIESKKITNKEILEDSTFTYFHKQNIPEKDSICMVFHHLDSNKVTFVPLDIKEILNSLNDENIFSKKI